ncbi:hypothetical protein [Calycomorphotria hydatis]|uniref:FecR protein n=1 Tax=Calycomorphotria hydatis TaxID=2528027 RepID=A0A517T707_9PLAN|nr:hypothetical protein [Calycomorphotria hydatis]QDT64147.1 FecR protein [Calycomorphotria hydatis]
MDDLSPTQAELIQLASTACDDPLNVENSKRLRELLAADVQNRLLFVELMDLQAQMVEYASAAMTTDSVVDAIKQPERRRTTQRILWTVFSIAACLMLIIPLGLWGFSQTAAFKGPVVATVNGFSHEAKLADGRTLAPGLLIHRRDRMELTEGFITLQSAEGATIDLQAPCQIEFLTGGDYRLIQGTLRAIVPPEAVGFTVRTLNARVVDYGTEFTVEYQYGEGTKVFTRVGRVGAFLVDDAGNDIQQMDITEGQAISMDLGNMREIGFFSNLFTIFDQKRGGIRRLDGFATLANNSPRDLTSGATSTPHHVLVIPERQQVTLESDLALQTLDGKRQLPTGTKLSSYLVHFDPGKTSTVPPKGSLDFHGEIIAIVAVSDELHKTDSLFGLDSITYPSLMQRGLELHEDGDLVSLSTDKKTVRFNLDSDPEAKYDQFRILVLEN